MSKDSNNKIWRSETANEGTQSKVSQEAYSDTLLSEMKLSSSLVQNTEMINKIIGGNVDLIERNFTLGRKKTISATLFYFDNMIDPKHLDINIMQPLLTDSYTSGFDTGPQIVSEIQAGNIITRSQIRKSKNIKELLHGLLKGEAVLLTEGIDEVFIINSKGYEYRNVTEPDVEPVVRGPKEAFIEELSVNLGLIRRRIHSPNLIFESLELGKVTKTTVCFGYIRGICSTNLIAEVRLRISKIDIDGVLESSFIEEFINDEAYSFFPQARNTERPDVACAALLEGRIVIIVDNTPVTLIVPGELFSLLQAPEDYYNRYIFSTLVRIIRYIAFIVALTLPSLYIAVTNYHQELIPTSLLTSIISSRTGVPLPNILEAFLMECTFEILREAGVRLPRPVGQAVSIVGALVIGQSAVQASLVSPLMVIVVSLTAIATFSIPQYNISHPIRILRFPLMLITAVLGFYGFILGLLFILIHLCSLRSFGVPYLAPLAPYEATNMNDTIIRSPLWTFITRPKETTWNNRRMSSNQKPKPPKVTE